MTTELPALHSLWTATASMPAHSALTGGASTHVCVVGAGLAGLCSAYLLAREGISVVLIDAQEPGAGETGRTTAHIAVPDDGYAHIEQAYGESAARLVAESFAAATDLIESIVRQERIDCDFQRLEGRLISCAADPERALLREFEAATRAGVDARFEQQHGLAHFPSGPALRFAAQATFHPLKFLAGLAQALQGLGAVIYSRTRALEVKEDERGVRVSSSGGEILAKAVVVATNTPVTERLALHTKQSAYQTYAIAARVPKGSVPRILLWDDGDPYHYVRLARDAHDDAQELLIVGGEDHKTGQEGHPEERFERLEQWMRRHFPASGSIAYQWSGQVMEPLDGLAYLGRSPGHEHTYLISGDSGNGMTHTVIGAMLIRDLVLGRTNPWSELYDPARKPLREALGFIKAQANVARQYAAWIGPGDVDSVASIAAGEGALVRHGVRKLAVHRDEQGVLHVRSAACPHLGCLVQWNNTEKSWDCPCHGSRFSARGTVMHGPSAADLAEVDEETRRALLEQRDHAKSTGSGSHIQR